MSLTNNRIAEIARQHAIHPAALLAVKLVESGIGGGFLPSKRCKILFEGHKFYEELKKKGNRNLSQLLKVAPDIVYPTWNRSKYNGGEGEWARLEKAITIDREAALKSTSWGLFQIMGSNYAACKCRNVEEFVSLNCESEDNQLELLINFLSTTGIIKYLNSRQWSEFARRYNGPGYKQNKYDTKLQAAYNQFVKEFPDEKKV